MTKTTIVWIVVCAALVTSLVFGYDFAYKKGRAYEHSTMVNVPAAVRVITKTDTVRLPSRIIKSVAVLRETVYVGGEAVITEKVETPVSLGNDSLGVSFTLIDKANEYHFLNPSFHYPSRKITETRYVDKIPESAGLLDGLYLKSQTRFGLKPGGSAQISFSSGWNIQTGAIDVEPEIGVDSYLKGFAGISITYHPFGGL